MSDTLSDYLQAPFTVYSDYVAVKAHFTTKTYNYIQYNGKSRASQKSFDQRKDKPFFYFLATKLNGSENLPFFVSQFIDNPCWIGDLVFDKKESMSRYTAWANRFESILENYKIDLINMAQNYDWKQLLSYKKGDHPELFKLVRRKAINPESYVLIDRITDFIQTTIKGLNDPIYSDLNLKYIKYGTFIPVTKEKILKITPKELTTLRR